MRNTINIFAKDWIDRLSVIETGPVNDIQRAPDRRDYFRLSLSASDEPLDACTILENGDSHSVEIINISASGLCCQTNVAHNFMQEQKLTTLFALPLDEPLILKIPSRIIEVKWHPVQKTTLIRLQFLPGLETQCQDQIHRFIIIRQLQKLRQENGY